MYINVRSGFVEKHRPIEHILSSEHYSHSEAFRSYLYKLAGGRAMGGFGPYKLGGGGCRGGVGILGKSLGTTFGWCGTILGTILGTALGFGGHGLAPTTWTFSGNGVSANECSVLALSRPYSRGGEGVSSLWPFSSSFSSAYAASSSWPFSSSSSSAYAASSSLWPQWSLECK